MMTNITLVAALFSLALTLLVLCANPYRFSNQVFALVLIVQTGWLGCVYRAMQIGAIPSPAKAAELEWWFRANATVISFLPATMWLLKCAIFAEPFGLLFSVAIFSPIALWIDKQTRAWLDIGGERKLAELRLSMMAIESSSPNTEELIRRFEVQLCTRFDTTTARFLFDNGPVYGHGLITMSKGCPGFSRLCKLGWATPESLERRRV